MVGTHDFDKFVTPQEMRFMVETTPAASSAAAGNEEDNHMAFTQDTVNGIVLQPSVGQIPGGLLACRPSSMVEWALSDTDLDVNYIAYYVKS
jgi:hypothetical protein